MKKSTLQDIAQLAGVGVATVDRVVNRRAPVREATAQKVLQAAYQLGYPLDATLMPDTRRASRALTLGLILLPDNYSFYQQLAQHLKLLAQPDHQLMLHFHAIGAVEETASVIETLAQHVDAIGLIALDNPLIRQAVERASQRGVKIFTLLSDLSPCGQHGYIGLDNRQAGRTAAWAAAHLFPNGGKTGIIVGDNGFLCQETCEISFRSWLRERQTAHQVLEPVKNNENIACAFDVTQQLLQQHSDLAVIYAPCGALEGVVAALRDSERQHEVGLICHGPFAESSQALRDGTVDLMLAHPLEALAGRILTTLVTACNEHQPGYQPVILPFALITPENH